MAQIPDFCGDRLRLSAFLRIVDDNGMPQRPTRFRRRTQLGESAMVVKTDTCSVIVGDSDDPEDDCPPTDPSTDLSLLDITYSPTSNNSLPEVVGNTVIREGYEIFELPQSVSIQQAQRREFDTTITKTLTEACSTSSIRKKRRLPVNELPLLRTTSSEGLPQPSDAGNFIAASAVAVDPIEDSQIIPCVTSRSSLTPLLSDREQEQKPLQIANDKLTRSPAWILKERINNLSVSRLQGTRGKFTATKFAAGSDGFTGTELTVQNARSPVRRRTNNRLRSKTNSTASMELALTCGHLPPPSTEHYVEPILIPERELSRSLSITHKLLPLPQFTLTEYPGAEDRRVVRNHYDYHSQPHETMDCSQRADVTAPLEHCLEASSSQVVNEETMISEVDNDVNPAYRATESSNIIPLVHLPTFTINTSYFGIAMHRLDLQDARDVSYRSSSVRYSDLV